MGFISCGNVVWNQFHNSISSYGMAFNHVFRINKVDISILVGCDVGLNSFLQLKEFWDLLAQIVVCFLWKGRCVQMFQGQIVLVEETIAFAWSVLMS